MFIELSDNERADLRRMLTARPWAHIAHYLLKTASVDRRTALTTRAGADTYLAVRDAQTRVQHTYDILKDIYRAVEIDPPAEVKGLLE